MPIPLPSVLVAAALAPAIPANSDGVLFLCLSSVFFGYLALGLAPRWVHTPGLVRSLCVGHSLLYVLLLVARLRSGPLPEGAGFGSLAAVLALFSDPGCMLAGWTHYIAFGLFVAQWIVQDAYESKIRHAAVLWLLPITLVAGPAGLCLYHCFKPLWLFLFNSKRAQVGLGGLSHVANTAPVRLGAAWRECGTANSVMYLGVSVLGAYMVAWVLILPGSWMIGNVPRHEAAIRKLWDQGMFNGTMAMPTPANLIFKYKGHSAVQFLHVLPSVLWSGALPLQLNPYFRKQHPKLHRATGYVFLLASVAMAAGFVIMDRRRLHFYLTDFPGIPEHDSMTHWPAAFGWVNHAGWARGLTGWFVLSLGISLNHARRKRFSAHRDFLYRHVGSGIWVAVQRLYVVGVSGLHVLRTGEPGLAPAEQKKVFGDGLFLGALFTMAVAEVAVMYARRPKAKAAKTS